MAGSRRWKAVLKTPKGNKPTSHRSPTVLPKTEFIDHAHIGNTCTRVQFNAPTRCPAKSILGTAVAYSPLLDKPLEGPVYFRSNGGERELPDLVADLNGQIHVDLVGFIDSVKKKGTETSRVRTRFQRARRPGLQVRPQAEGRQEGADRKLRQPLQGRSRREVKMAGQNGKTYDFEPKVANGCGKGKTGRELLGRASTAAGR